jgi:hypothetical protein
MQFASDFETRAIPIIYQSVFGNPNPVVPKVALREADPTCRIRVQEHCTKRMILTPTLVDEQSITRPLDSTPMRCILNLDPTGDSISCQNTNITDIGAPIAVHTDFFFFAIGAVKFNVVKMARNQAIFRLVFGSRHSR